MGHRRQLRRGLADRAALPADDRLEDVVLGVGANAGDIQLNTSGREEFSFPEASLFCYTNSCVIMYKKNIYLITLTGICLVLGALVTWYQIPKKYNAGGVSFSVARSFHVEEIPSTAENYKNFRVESKNFNSNIVVHLPLKASEPAFSLADIVTPYASTNIIHTATVAGHTAQVAQFHSTGSSSSAGEISNISIVSFTSSIPSSPIIISYQRLHGDTALATTWSQIITSLKW